MVRRRSTPWIHRWSRPIIAMIAALGTLETAYLTIVKLTGGSVACPTQGCDAVLNSPYASVFGLPLTLFGFLAYLSLGICAIAPFFLNPSSQKEQRSQVDRTTWQLMFALSTAMLIFSSYLMYLLIFKIGELCPYCIASALFATSLFVLTLVGHVWPDLGQQLLTGVAIAFITLIATLGLYSSVQASYPARGTPGATSAPITTTSGPAEIALARHLKQIGAKEYGAYWCPHCYDQKLLFGKEAFAIIDYVECDPKGQNARPQLCQKAGITGYPTWEIKGKLYPGTQPLETLAKLSGYTGNQTFKNKLSP